MSTGLRVVSCLLIWALGWAPAVAQDRLDFGTTVFGTGFAHMPFLLVDDVILETDGLHDAIRSYTSATEPDWIGWNEHTQDGYWWEVLYDDGLLVALREGVAPGFSVVDMTDFSAPVPLAEISGSDYNSGWLRDRSLLVSLSSVVLVYDLTDAADPAFGEIVLVGEREASRYFSEVDDLLYLVDHGAVLRVLDISDPLHPVDLGTAALPGDEIAAMVAGAEHLQVLLATAAGAGHRDLELATFDISSPLAPVETDRRLILSAADPRVRSMVQAGELLLTATNDDRVRAFALDDPAHPEPGWELAQAADRVVVNANQIFLSSATEVLIYPRGDASTPPTAAVERTVLPRLANVVGEGPIQITQLFDQTSHIAPVDVTNPYLPKIGASFDTGLEGSLIYADQLGLILNQGGQWQLLDLADATEPVLLGAIDEPGENYLAAALSREVLAVGALGAKYATKIYDLSDPDQPERTAAVSFGLPRCIHDDLMIISAGGQVSTVTLADLWNPRLLRSLELHEPVLDVGLQDDHVYVLTYSGPVDRKLHVIDVVDPTDPQLLISMQLDIIAGRMAFNGSRLHLTSYSMSQIYDISVPGTPQLAAEFPTPGHTGYGMAFHGDVITYSGWLITRRDDGLLPTAVPEAVPVARCRLEPAHPNPFNPSTTLAFSVDRRRELTVTVHDLSGRRIATLAAGIFGPGRHTVGWNGQDSTGRAMASGIYLVRLHGVGLDAAQSVTLVK